MKYKIVKCEFEESTHKLENATVLNGPVEGALIVLLPTEAMNHMAMSGTLMSYTKNVEEQIKKTGFDGEIIFMSDTIRFAHLEKVEEDSEIETMICHKCANEMHRDVRAVKCDGFSVSVLIKQPGWYCDVCGESVLSPEDAKYVEEQLKG